MKRYAWQAALLLVVLWLDWQALASNLAEHYLQRAQAGERAALATALWWRPDHPRALALQGRWLLRDGKPQEAEAWLQRAVPGDPADARPLVDLALVRAAAGNVALADEHDRNRARPDARAPGGAAQHRAVLAAARRAGARHRARRHGTLGRTPACARSSSRCCWPPRKIRRCAARWNRSPPSPPVGGPASSSMRAARRSRPTAWRRCWRCARTAKEFPVSDSERESLLQRLHRDGRVADAYLLWVNSLDAKALEQLGYVFDGGFERPLGNSGFGWFGNVPRNAGFRISTGAAYGMTGERAVHIAFSGKRAPFQHLYQNLFLGPGRYEVSGQVRPEDLRARRGLQWRVNCNAGGNELLGESEFLLGSSEWRRFAFDIEVPAHCAGQVLRLHSAGNRDVDHELQGGIWFDELRIARKPEPRAHTGQ